MKKLEIYGTLGPSCCTKETLIEMFKLGMTGVRLNLSHVDLDECEEWLNAFHQAAEVCHIKPDLLIDMKGPELRIGKLKEPLIFKENEIISLSCIPMPSIVLEHLHNDVEMMLDDGKILLRVKDVKDNDFNCLVIRGGKLTSSKSIALVDVKVMTPTLTESDIKNLKLAKKYGVTGIMQPFVRNQQDLITVKETLKEVGASDLKLYAKIENMDGVRNLESLLPYTDYIIIARGDLGNAMPLYELPRVQKLIQSVCQSHHVPYMIVTQMLNSMIENAVPTRAEVSDIFYAVYHGADSIMLTGETAAGKYPLEAMKYFVNTAMSALEERTNDII